ncbi:hypothetical protein Slin14017_G055960 [Septoria linicola]|nr:hypothetical protein Slin14017_G055960 [Septoria linicola]
MAPPDDRAAPGHDFMPLPFQMKAPYLDFVYRLSCEMASDNYAVGAPFGGAHSRMTIPISGGTVRGPYISAEIQKMGGADWGTAVTGTGVSFAIKNSQATRSRFVEMMFRHGTCKHVESYFHGCASMIVFMKISQALSEVAIGPTTGWLPGRPASAGERWPPYGNRLALGLKP